MTKVIRGSRSRGFTVAALAAAAAVLGPGAAARAAVVQTFDTTAAGANPPAPFVEAGPAVPAGGTADYVVQPAAGGSAPPIAGNTLQANISGTVTVAAGQETMTVSSGVNRSASVPDTTLTATDFVISTNFRVNSTSGTAQNNTMNLGLVALGTNTDFSSGSNYRLLYTLTSPGGTSPTGRLTLSEIGATGTAINQTSAAAITPSTTATYTMTLTGTRAGGTLTLTGTLTDGIIATPLTVTGSDTTPTAGSNFGYRTAVNASLVNQPVGTTTTASQVIQYDNFSLVPEPTSLALAGLAGVGLLARRRRR